MSSQHTNIPTPRLIPSPGRSTRRERRDGRLRRGLRRLGLVGVVLLLTLGSGTVAAVYLVGERLTNSIGRISGVFDGLDPATRPTTDPVLARGETILAVGTDLDHPGGSATEIGTADQRTDVIMMMRLDRLHNSASVVSIPRDAWVEIPGHGTMKLNAAYPLGGPSLLIRTVEHLTKIRIDHFMVIDFAGFRSVVDALGGVDIELAEDGKGSNGVRFSKGVNRMDGHKALAYVRERESLPAGDLDRIRRQQNFLRAVFTGIAKIDPTENPVRLYKLLDAATRAVTVDDSYQPDELRELAFEAAKLRADRLWFLTAPVIGPGWEGDQSVIYLDTERCAHLWQALRTDQMADYVAANQQDLLPNKTR